MSDSHWQEPLRWNAAAHKDNVRPKVFCASMADVFDDQAPDGQLDRLWQLIRNTPNLDWQILTKRPHRIQDKLPSDWGLGYSNVWLGTSIEDSRVLDRIEHLLNVPAIIRFLSLEPLIGPLNDIPLEGIHWVIVGGESGKGARPMEESWVLSIQEQCASANVPFFFKQWGGVHKSKTGRALRNQYYDELPVITE